MQQAKENLIIAKWEVTNIYLANGKLLLKAFFIFTFPTVFNGN